MLVADAKVCSWQRNVDIIMEGGDGVWGNLPIIRKAALATFRADYVRHAKASKLLQNSWAVAGVDLTAGDSNWDLFNILVLFILSPLVST